MGKRNTAADFYLIDLRRTEIRVWPLYGLNRLIKLDHRNRSGVLYCDNVMRISESSTFSEANERTVPYTIYHGLGLHGALSEPRMNVPNEATQEELKRFRDDGVEIVISFTPQKGKTVSTEFEIYKTFDAGYRKGQLEVDDDRRIAKWELTLDVSAYLAAGHLVSDIRCEYESAAESNRVQKATLGRTRAWRPWKKGPACGVGGSTTCPVEPSGSPGGLDGATNRNSPKRRIWKSWPRSSASTCIWRRICTTLC